MLLNNNIIYTMILFSSFFIFIFKGSFPSLIPIGKLFPKSSISFSILYTFS